jgi:glutaconate CoA-transferase subunit A
MADDTWPLRASKLVDPATAAALIDDGSHLAVGGIWSQNAPTGLVREVIRRGVKSLTISGSPAGGFAIDLLIASGVATHGYLPNVTLEHLGLAPAFRAAVEQGRFTLTECDEPTLVGGYLAAAAGLPFTPLTSIVGTALADVAPWLTATTHGEADVLLAPAIAPDVVFIHAQEGDMFGNVRQLGSVFTDRVMVKAARRAVVVSVDRIVENEEIRRDPGATTIPGYLVTHVVEMPMGAHPCASHARYIADEEHILRYVAVQRESRAEGSEAWANYRARHVDVPHEAYLESVGGVTALQARLGEGIHR